jgi:hypothetical protein
MKAIIVIALCSVLAGCASGGDEPSRDDVSARLNSEYIGVSLPVFISKNGVVQSQIDDPVSGTTIYTWQVSKEDDDDFCRLSLRVDTSSHIIKQVTIINSATNSVDTFWFLHHKYIQACKAVK